MIGRHDQAIPPWGCGQPFSLGRGQSFLLECGPAYLDYVLFCVHFTKQEIISCHLLHHIAYEPGLTLHHLEAQ